MIGAGRKDNAVDGAGEPPVRFRDTQHDFQFTRRSFEALYRCRNELQNARVDAFLDDGFRLRSDAEAVNIPIGPEMANDAALFGNRQRRPKTLCLSAYRINDGLPRYALSGRASDGLSRSPQ